MNSHQTTSCYKDDLSKASKVSSKRVGIILIGILFLVFSYYFGKKVCKLEKNYKTMQNSLKKLKCNAVAQGFFLGGVPAPVQLRKIPFAETQGIVLGTKTIPIRNVFAPYNGCILKKEDAPGYHLLFRYDVSKPAYSSYIGIVELDDKFEQTAKEFRRIDTHSKYSEDPRIVKVGEEHYICYNDIQFNDPKRRSMRIGSLSLEDASIKYITNLDLHLQHIEKNWVPFEYIDENNRSRLMFEYHLSPHKILELPDPQVNYFHHWIFSDLSSQSDIPWKKHWGPVRGGTPLQKIGNEYLGFFHSSFKDLENVTWYSLGAYTVEAKPPFSITAVSKHPILFNGIYDTPLMNKLCGNKLVIFPSGFVVEKQSGKEVIQLTCGENDSAIKLITIDKEALLKSMIPCGTRNSSSK